MTAKSLIGFGLLILLLLPALVAETERRRVHDGFHLALAAAGLAYAGVTGGAAAVLLALATGAASALLLGAAVALAQSRWRMRPLTGGHIKLFAASSVWLGPIATVIMLLLATAVLIGWVVVARRRTIRIGLPAISPIAAVSVLAAFAITSLVR
jgi:Flp pilus assembly protein protease CpaA